MENTAEKKHNLFIRMLLMFGFHYWKYSGSRLALEDGDIRKCKWSHKEQEYIYEGPDESGWSNLGHWKNI